MGSSSQFPVENSDGPGVAPPGLHRVRAFACPTRTRDNFLSPSLKKGSENFAKPTPDLRWAQREGEPPMDSTRIFNHTHFASRKEWIYFCLEFDLQLCDRCMAQSRRRPRSPVSTGPVPPWICCQCVPPLHPDLAQAVRTRENVTTTCHLCQQSVALEDCWISEDCQRLYCSTHLRPAAWEDVQTPAASRPSIHRAGARGAPAAREPARMSRIDPATAGWTQRPWGIYDGPRLIEMDPTELARWRREAPDPVRCRGK